MSLSQYSFSPLTISIGSFIFIFLHKIICHSRVNDEGHMPFVKLGIQIKLECYFTIFVSVLEKYIFIIILNKHVTMLLYII